MFKNNFTGVFVSHTWLWYFKCTILGCCL